MSGEAKRSTLRVRKPQTRVPKSTRRKQRPAVVQGAAETQPYGSRSPSEFRNPGVSITVQLPAIRRQKVAADATTSQPRQHRILSPLLLVPILILAGAFVIFGDVAIPGTKAPATTKPVAAADRTKPAYAPLVPSAEKASATKYDAKRDLVTYTTQFSGAKLTVSQQPIPQNFTKDSQGIVKAADSIKATKIVTTDKGPLYIATNDEAGSQLAVYAAKDTLVFIHSASKLDDISWKSFVELLEAKPWNDLARG